jgi:hypothetical protein
MSIHELGKPAGMWCPHCIVNKGCGIYDTRPQSCRSFFCLYLIQADIPDDWYPARSKMVLSFSADGGVLSVFVDGGRPDAWKAEPYHAQLRAWAGRAAAKNRQVLVRIGKRVVAILPDRDVDLGVVQDDELVVTEYSPAASGFVSKAFKLKKDDPRVLAAAARK